MITANEPMNQPVNQSVKQQSIHISTTSIVVDRAGNHCVSVSERWHMMQVLGECAGHCAFVGEGVPQCCSPLGVHPGRAQ